MSVETLGSTGSNSVTSADSGKLFVLTGSQSLSFGNVNLTGRRFEVFNNTGSIRSIAFASGTVVNESPGATTISVPAYTHVVVMGIGLGQYIAWRTN
jgi:hypothetical protein